MSLTRPPVVRTQMLIRKPVEVVFESFIDPAITSRFWFTKGSGRLEQGRVIRWDWEMYGVGADVAVKVIEPNQRIAIEWPTPVEWQFAGRPDGTTFVTIICSGFPGTDDEQVAAAIDNMGGFSFALAACKAFLEHGIQLNLVADHAPDAHVH